MTIEELKELVETLDIDLNPRSNMIYVFYTTPDGAVNNLSISVRRAKLPNGHKMSDGDLAGLMQQYPGAREGTIMAVERPHGNLHRWMDAVEVCQALHTSRQTLRRWIHCGILHPSTMGRKLYFDAEEVDRILRENMIRESGRLDETALESLRTTPQPKLP